MRLLTGWLRALGKQIPGMTPLHCSMKQQPASLLTDPARMRGYYTGRKYSCCGIAQLRYALGWRKRSHHATAPGFSAGRPAEDDIMHAQVLHGAQVLLLGHCTASLRPGLAQGRH